MRVLIVKYDANNDNDNDSHYEVVHDDEDDDYDYDDGADGEGEYINSLAFTAIGTIWHCKAERPLVGDALGKLA